MANISELKLGSSDFLLKLEKVASKRKIATPVNSNIAPLLPPIGAQIIMMQSEVTNQLNSSSAIECDLIDEEIAGNDGDLNKMQN